MAASSLILLFGVMSLVQPAAAKVPFSAVSVDARTGRVLSAIDPDGLRHPASLTKMMTLYLLFQDLETGKIKLDSPILISARAASMAPSKLGVRPGTAITVETAIKALVVKSANDVASAVAENFAGTEAAFAERMTQTARAIGMKSTVFRNASGLPNPGQWTTARDMATLGLRLQRDFPQYYPYFRTMAFTYAGRTTRTHNRLLGKFEGTDGIKTGYIAASGFNLTTSAKRGNKRIVGVVMGGTSGRSRDAYMKKMLAKVFPKCIDGMTIAAMAGSSKGAIEPVAAKTETAEATPAETEAQPAAADTSAGDQSGEDAVAEETQAAENDVAVGSTIKTVTARKTKRKVEPKVVEARIETPALPEKLPFAVKLEANQADVTPATTQPDVTTEATPPDVTTEATPPAETQAVAALPVGTWYIQIGGYATKQDATDRLLKLRANGPRELRDKQAFTVTIQKGDTTTYRARFSGFTEKTARETCKQLARKNLRCYVVEPNS